MILFNALNYVQIRMGYYDSFEGNRSTLIHNSILFIHFFIHLFIDNSIILLIIY